jgi:prefoldin subunit 5
MLDILLALIPVIGGVIAVWVNLNSTVARLKSRVIQLELQQDELKKDIKELLHSVHNIELMVAKMQAK